MSYRLITKATIAINNNERMADVRAYAAPKGAAIGQVQLNGNAVDFKLTGGQGRGTVVRCYAYFMLNGESAYIEISATELASLKAGNHGFRVDVATTSPEAPDTVEDLVDAVSEAVEPAPKAKRNSRKGQAA